MATLTTPTTPTVAVLRLQGELGPSEMDSLTRLLTDMLVEGRHQVVLNFKQVTHVSLGGIAKLAQRNQRFSSLGGEIKLVGLTPYVTNLFTLVGALSQFDASTSEEEAIARFER